METLVARQPIFDRAMRIEGYELLYRHTPASQAADGATPNEMTRQVVVDAFLGFGLERVTDGMPAFVNVSRELLMSGGIELFDPRHFVVEIVETIQPDRNVVDSCRRLVARGYRLALDDFTYSEPMEALLDLAEIVKLDVMDYPGPQLDLIVERLKPFRVRLLAEKVESRAELDACVALGFELFQGFHFRRPELLNGRDLAVEQLRTFRLMRLIRDLTVPDSEIEEAFRSDLSLSYKLLRMVRSAAIGTRGIQSIGHAIRLLGREALYRWLALLLVSAIEPAGGNAELVRASLVRARFCEQLAMAGPRPLGAGSLFIIGLLSNLDVLLGLPMQDLVGQMDLTYELQAALLVRQGSYGAALAMVEAYEVGRWDDVIAWCSRTRLGPDDVASAYLAALKWVRDRLPEECVAA